MFVTVYTHTATASDVELSDGESEGGVVEEINEAGMQVAVRERDGQSDHSEDDEGDEMEVLDPSHVSCA